MSRRSRRAAKKHLRNVQRDILIPIARIPAAHNILALEDRRTFEPGDRFPRAQFHRSARVVVSPNVNKQKGSRHDKVPAKIRFAVPREVALCVRRKQRREVLFALRQHGKGSKARRRRRTFFSSVSC